eukprot:822342-Pelagomonas_calceolata.AAC.1
MQGSCKKQAILGLSCPALQVLHAACTRIRGQHTPFRKEVLLCIGHKERVVGVVYKGHDVLRVMSGQQTNHNDAPVQKIQVGWHAACQCFRRGGCRGESDNVAYEVLRSVQSDVFQMGRGECFLLRATILRAMMQNAPSTVSPVSSAKLCVKMRS